MRSHRLHGLSASGALAGEAEATIGGRPRGSCAPEGPRGART